MAGNPRGRRQPVPAMRSTYDESYNTYKRITTDDRYDRYESHNPSGVPAPALQYSAALVPNAQYVYTTASEEQERLSMLEGRIFQQEMRSQDLVEKAVRIKGDVIDALNFTQGSRSEEQQARSLLQEHVHSITDVVRTLYSDISALERRVRSRNTQTAITNSNIKELEHTHAAALDEMQSKLSHADSMAAQLAGEMRGLHDALKQTTLGNGGSVGRLADRIQALERQLGIVGSAVDLSNSEKEATMQMLQGESSKFMSFLDSRSRAMVDELRNAITSQQTYMTNEYQKLDKRLTSHCNNALTTREARLNKLEQATLSGVSQLHARCDAIETDARALRDELSKTEAQMLALQQLLQQHPLVQGGGVVGSVTSVTSVHSAGDCELNIRRLERYLELKASRLDKRYLYGLQKLKEECREGFNMVRVTVENLDKVSDGKLCLLEEQLLKELAFMRSTVVLI